MSEVGYSAGGPVIHPGQSMSRPAAFASGVGSSGPSAPSPAQSNPLSADTQMTNELLSSQQFSGGNSSSGKSSSGGLMNDVEHYAEGKGLSSIAKNVGSKIWNTVKGAGEGDMGDAVAAAGEEEMAGGGPEDPVADAAALGTLGVGAVGSILKHIPIHF